MGVLLFTLAVFVFSVFVFGFVCGMEMAKRD